MNKLIVLFLSCLLIGACATQDRRTERPAWIDNPGTGVSASCTTHVKERHFQEELAISRAREKLAARYGVTVKMTQNNKEVVVNDSASVNSVKYTQQAIGNGNVVYAQVKEKWHDEIRGELWVWVVPAQ